MLINYRARMDDRVVPFVDVYEKKTSNSMDSSIPYFEEENNEDSDRMKIITSLKNSNHKLKEENNSLRRKLVEFEEVKKKLHNLEVDHDKLKVEYDEVLCVSKSELMNDPRIMNKVNKEKENRIRQLEIANANLQAQLDKGVEKSYDLSTVVKKEKV